jgi:hypothetical protein
VVLHCFANCPAESIVRALGLSMADLFPQKSGAKRLDTYNPDARAVMVRSYDYTDANGQLVYQALRYREPDGGKTFRQRQPHPTSPGEWHARI